VGEARMVNGSPWGQGSYGITPGHPFAVGTRLYGTMQGPHPVGAHSVGEATMLDGSP
jgi:hypothetical protein